MLRVELIDIINSGKAWAFVGAGASIESGGPTWKKLLEMVLSKIEESDRNSIIERSSYKKNLGANNLPRCFSEIEKRIGRAKLDGIIKTSFSALIKPGRIITKIADWPFEGYITTNYDNLLGVALGWTSIGNVENEIRKISGDVSNVIWHIHGCIDHDKSRSHFVLTEEDYDNLYLNQSQLLTQLQGLLSHRRLLFIGFSMEDLEIMRILKRVGRLCNPARPAFAILSGIDNELDRLDYLKRYNIDIIPYHAKSGSHERLHEIIDFYGSMILRRSLKFGQPDLECPSFHPETTGLLIYNQLCLANGTPIHEDIIGTLLRSRILSLLKVGEKVSIDNLKLELSERANIIRRRSREASFDSELQTILNHLETQGHIEIERDQNGMVAISISQRGAELVLTHRAKAEMLGDQFREAIIQRAKKVILSIDEDSILRVAKVAETFLKDCAQKRSIGVAMAWYGATTDAQQSYHIVALLQELPTFMQRLNNSDEAIALTKLVQDLLATPGDIEKSYLGMCIQAQFGIHLLGYDKLTLETRARDFSNTLFLVDSSTLIPFLARSSIAYNSSRLLISRLSNMGSVVATTQLLAHEAAEHARWARSKVDSSGHLDTGSLEAVTGKAGQRDNAFLDGFIKEINIGKVSDFLSYINAIFKSIIIDGYCTDRNIQSILNEEDLLCCTLNDIQGKTNAHWDEKEIAQKEIKKKRERRKTFKHDRQVEAEAEAMVIIRNIRNGTFNIKDRKYAGAIFISHTRIIDDIVRPGNPITMCPEAVMQWTATISHYSLDEMKGLVDSLLWELSERDMTIIDQNKLKITFSPLIAATKGALEEELIRHRSLIAQRYGEDAIGAFNEINNVDQPIVVANLLAQRANDLEEMLTKEQQLRIEAQQQAKISDKDRKRLAILESEKQQKKKRAQSRKRASQSRKKKRKKK
jgi:hypothetical protein